MNVMVESGTPLTVDAHIHDTSHFASELVESSISSQISSYTFATPLIGDEIDHETLDSSVVTSSGTSESSRVDYDFMIIPTVSFSSESSEFLIMIQHVVSSASCFIDCLEFTPKSCLSLAGFDVCHPRHLISLFLIVRSYG